MKQRQPAERKYTAQKIGVLQSLVNQNMVSTMLDPDGEEVDIYEQLATDESPLDEKVLESEIAGIINTCLDSIKPRQKEVIIRRYGLQGIAPSTQRAIAASLGITGTGVRKLESVGMKNLRRQFKNNGLADDLILSIAGG